VADEPQIQDRPRSRSRLPQGCVASPRGARVGVEPLSGRDCWPQGQALKLHPTLNQTGASEFHYSSRLEGATRRRRPLCFSSCRVARATPAAPTALLLPRCGSGGPGGASARVRAQPVDRGAFGCPAVPGIQEARTPGHQGIRFARPGALGLRRRYCSSCGRWRPASAALGPLVCRPRPLTTGSGTDRSCLEGAVLDDGPIDLSRCGVSRPEQTPLSAGVNGLQAPSARAPELAYATTIIPRLVYPP
jgi:hypothetical protein